MFPFLKETLETFNAINVSLIMEEKDTYMLYEIALEIFSKYGIRSVTMDDISRELGMSKKTVYQQISDKKELVNRVMEHEIDRMNRNLDEMSGSEYNAIEELIEVNKRVHNAIGAHSPTFYYDLKKHYPDLFKQWNMRRRMIMVDMIMRNLNKGKKEGLYRNEMDEKIISKLYMARMEMLHDNDFIKNEESVSRDFFREIILYHLHGICNDKGLKYISQHHEII
jgi:AcrR family transcriptional regulator